MTGAGLHPASLARMVAAAGTLAAGIANAAAQEAPAAKDAPPALSNSVQITSRPPDPEKWVSKTDTKTGTRVFVCKPLACPDQARVNLSNARSPTRNPDPKALEKFAKVDFPKSLQSGNAVTGDLASDRQVETLAAATATLKGFPSVSNESKITTGDKIAYLNVAIIFAGPAMIQMSALSPDREFSQKILAQFVELLEIKDSPKPAPGAAPPSVTPLQPAPQGSPPRPSKQQSI